MALSLLRHLLIVPHARSRLTAFERARLAGEVLQTYVLVRWWLLRLDFPSAVEAARGVRSVPSPGEEEAAHTAFRLGSAVQMTLRAAPLDARCLAKSLVLTRMLARRGIASKFILGVRSKPEFMAHAWLERSGEALLPTGPEFHRIAEL